MQGKFGRNYTLLINDFESKTVLTVRPPFTLKFAINRSFFGSPNSATIQIYGLNEDSRAFIRKDQNDSGFIKGVVFLAGYGDDLSVCLKGNISIGSSTRPSVDNITTIQCFDGGASFVNSNFSGQFYQGTSDGTMLRTMAKSLEQYGVTTGAISPSYNNKIKRGNSYSGNAIDLMTEITGGGTFIDNGVIHSIKDNEYIKGDVLLINSQTGLLATPTREWNNVTFNMIFEPRLYIAQKIRIEIGSKEFDGDYIVRGISHNGTISESIGETCTSSVTCSPAKFMIGLGV